MAASRHGSSPQASADEQEQEPGHGARELTHAPHIHTHTQTAASKRAAAAGKAGSAPLGQHRVRHGQRERVVALPLPGAVRRVRPLPGAQHSDVCGGAGGQAARTGEVEGQGGVQPRRRKAAQLACRQAAGDGQAAGAAGGRWHRRQAPAVLQECCAFQPALSTPDLTQDGGVVHPLQEQGVLAVDHPHLRQGQGQGTW